MDINIMHLAESGECMNPNPGRSSMSHKPPLSPYYSSAQPLVNSFSASFSMFSADRVQSSPCIMQTDHAGSLEDNRSSHEPMQEGKARTECLAGSGRRPAGTDACVLHANSDTRTSGSFNTEPCGLWSALQMEGCTALNVPAGNSATQEAVSAETALLGPTNLEPQSSLGPSTFGQHGLQQATGMQAHCQRLAEPGLQAVLDSDQGSAGDEHMVCCSGDASAEKAAASAASLSGPPAASSPCCTFPLPTALSQGISASPASSGDSSLEGLARRKSFSPLESGPVSILPLEDNALIGLPSVSCSTLAQLIAGQHDSPSVAVKIVDCR